MGQGRGETRAQAAARERQPGGPRAPRGARVVAHHRDRTRAGPSSRHRDGDRHAPPRLRGPRRARHLTPGRVPEPGQRGAQGRGEVYRGGRARHGAPGDPRGLAQGARGIIGSRRGPVGQLSRRRRRRIRLPPDVPAERGRRVRRSRDDAGDGHGPRRVGEAPSGRGRCDDDGGGGCRGVPRRRVLRPRPVRTRSRCIAFESRRLHRPPLAAHPGRQGAPLVHAGERVAGSRTRARVQLAVRPRRRAPVPCTRVVRAETTGPVRCRGAGAVPRQERGGTTAMGRGPRRVRDASARAPVLRGQRVESGHERG